MSDNITVFGTSYTGVTGIKAKGTGNGVLTYIRPTGTKSITENGTGIDVAAYSTVDVSVSGDSDVFVVTVSYNNSTEMWEPDCTYAQVAAANTAGKTIVLDADGQSSAVSADGDWNTSSSALNYWVREFDDGKIVESQYNLASSGLSLSGKWNYTSPPSLQSKSVSYTPTESAQSATVTADSGYDGLSSVAVSVGAISSTYVGTGITRRTSSDLTTNGETVNVPAGYYASAASKAVATGTAGTPTATKGTVSNHSIAVTPSVTNTTGYISGGTKTGTAVMVSASELVSGNLAITENGTGIDVTNYETVSVAVPSGGGSSMNVQVAQSTTRSTSTTYTEVISLTCDTAGTYDVYWTTFRSSTSSTWGSQLYLGSTAYGTADTGGWSNHVQNKHLTGVAIAANQKVSVRVRSRGSNYYGYVGTLTIVQTA